MTWKPRAAPRAHSNACSALAVALLLARGQMYDWPQELGTRDGQARATAQVRPAQPTTCFPHPPFSPRRHPDTRCAQKPAPRRPPKHRFLLCRLARECRCLLFQPAPHTLQVQAAEYASGTTRPGLSGYRDGPGTPPTALTALPTLPLLLPEQCAGASGRRVILPAASSSRAHAAGHHRDFGNPNLTRRGDDGVAALRPRRYWQAPTARRALKAAVQRHPDLRVTRRPKLADSVSQRLLRRRGRAGAPGKGGGAAIAGARALKRCGI